MEFKLNNKQILIERVKPLILAKQTKIEKQDFIGLIKDLIEENDVNRACYEISNYLIQKHFFITFSDTQEIYIYDKGVFTLRGEETILKDVQDLLHDYCKIHIVNEVIGHIKRSTLLSRNSIKENPTLICINNGIINLEKLKSPDCKVNMLSLEEHKPDCYFFNKLPVSFDPHADCPAIKQFLSEIINPNDISLVQEFAGFCLYKEYFIHKSFLLIGSGANGKSTFLNVLRSFLGVDNVASLPLQSLETNRFASSSLQSKLVNIFADLPAKALSGTSMFKMLVGQDLVHAERKFKGQFFFVNYAKFIFSANQIPKSPEDTDGFFRRWIIINFPNQFLNKKADKQLLKKLTSPEELSGFLNFALEGLKRILSQGDFSCSQSIEEIREQYIRMSDSVGAFDLDIVLTSPDSYIPKKQIYTAFCDYCRAKGYPIVSESTFHKELQAKRRVEDYRPLLERDGKKERVQCWRGITLKLETRPDNLDILDLNVSPVNVVKVDSNFNSGSIALFK